VLTAVVTGFQNGVPQVGLVSADFCERTDLTQAEIDAILEEQGPDAFTIGSENCPELNPIAPELDETLWGFGAFVVLAIAIRYFLFPKIREGMAARYDRIHDDQDSADTLTASARADVAEYEARLSSVRAEAQSKVDAARATLEAERAEQLAAVNARIAQKRAAVQAEVDAAREAARVDVEGAVTDVVTRATELATGRAPDPDTVRSAVGDAMGAEVSA